MVIPVKNKLDILPIKVAEYTMPMRIVYRLRIQQTITGTGVKDKGIVIAAGIMPTIKWASII
jgi:hypothetical protein